MHKLKSICAITDLTVESDACVAAAAKVAALNGATLHLVNAQPEHLPFRDFIRMTFTPRRYARQLAALMNEQIARTVAGLCPVTAEINVDAFSELLLQQIRDREADLVVVSRSVNAVITQVVIARAQAATIILSRPLHLPLRRVVLPITTPASHEDSISAASDWVERLSGTTADGARSHEGIEFVKAAWRGPRSEHPAELIRRLVDGQDVDLLVVPLRRNYTGRLGTKLSALNRAALATSQAVVLFVPVAPHAGVNSARMAALPSSNGKRP
ncbi:MAG TPA: universal stress protein [Longimicrobiales bacterium]